MRLVLLGAPGSGKGTQAVRLMQALDVPHISTGDLLRAAVAAGTTLGVQAKAVMERGELVSDDIVLGMLEERLHADDIVQGFVLDGYPRNTAQAHSLDTLLARLGQPVDQAVLLDVDTELLIERIAGRAKAEGRSDDTPETVRNRLRIFNEQTAPVIDFYANSGRLIRVDGVGEVEQITERVLSAVEDASAS